MTIIKFEIVKYRAEKKIKCAAGCGRTVKRAKTFDQTINPFNKNVEGYPKTRQQITEELAVEAKTWRETPEACSHCYPHVD
jgi:hypothetical protein